MEQNLKELLLKDLCVRLPYGVMCHINGDDTNTPRKLSRIEVDELDGILLDFWTDREDYLSIQVYLSEVKPYLRPMSSMTEEEIVEINSMGFAYWTTMINNDLRARGPMSLLDAIITHHKMVKLIDWLNAHHFDYRGLIEKGLALEAPEGMYKEWISIRGNLKEDKEGNIIGGLKL